MGSPPPSGNLPPSFFLLSPPSSVRLLAATRCAVSVSLLMTATSPWTPDSAGTGRTRLLLLARGCPFSLPKLFLVGPPQRGQADARGRQAAVYPGGRRGAGPALRLQRLGSVRFMPSRAYTGYCEILVEEEGRTSRCGDCNDNSLIMASSSSMKGLYVGDALAYHIMQSPAKVGEPILCQISQWWRSWPSGGRC
ncbi:uncharacterized protein [Lolium perenne]|uniref:uncharacterized protein isoform X2 n=1 Tax=Lolium perenne TaxID=4522 RepID=UPI0021F52B5D|nr:uncharacterized protein LOC127334822 isoform X2 [Lolium perenne]